MKHIKLLSLLALHFMYTNMFSQDTLYYANGKIKQIGNQKNGLYKYFDEYGNLMAKGSFVNGKENGEWFYYTEDGKLNSKANFLDGKQIGEYVGYFKDGTVSAKYTLDKNGVLIGDSYKYYKSGKVHSKTSPIKNGTNNETEYIEYYENGTISEKGKLNDSKKNGEWLYYTETGEVKKKVFYKNDVEVSPKK